MNYGKKGTLYYISKFLVFDRMNNFLSNQHLIIYRNKIKYIIENHLTFITITYKVTKELLFK